MAISVISDFEGATLDQYHQVLEKMGLTKGRSGCSWDHLPLGCQDR
jgi:hypothetical protein